jgi:hypothetical protein
MTTGGEYTTEGTSADNYDGKTLYTINDGNTWRRPIEAYGAFVDLQRVSDRTGSGGTIRASDYHDCIDKAFAALDRGDDVGALGHLRKARLSHRLGQYNQSHGYFERRPGGRTLGARNRADRDEPTMRMMDAMLKESGDRRPYVFARKAIKGTVPKDILEEEVRRLGNKWKLRHGIGN